MNMKAFLYAVLLGAVLPWILLYVNKDRKSVQDTPLSQPTEPTIDESQVCINVLGEDNVLCQMDLEEYILGVLIGEMPPDFEPEALKAQAVVARTFAVKSMKKSIKHPDGAVCVESACCQAYMDPFSYLDNGGTEVNLEKFWQAIISTRGEVLSYNGELIEATYFSCSGGKTEGAQAVWGTDVPYLQSVDSPGEEKAEHYADTVTFAAEDFQKRIGLSGNFKIGKIIYTTGGGVQTIEIGNQTYTGTQLRKLLGLNSTAFVITAMDNAVIVTTKGFGHRVGMSQYGADAMAVQGRNYQEILSYYYPGTSLENLENI